MSTKKTNQDRPLGLVMDRAEKTKLEAEAISQFHWVKSYDRELLDQLFGLMELEWNLLTFSRLPQIDGKPDWDFLSELLVCLERHPEKSARVIEKWSELRARFLIDETTLELARANIALAKEKADPPRFAVYASTAEQKNELISAAEPKNFGVAKLFGEISLAKHGSTVEDAVDYVCDRADRVLAISHLGELGNSPRELKMALTKIYVAESSVFVKNIEGAAFRWIWDRGSHGGVPEAYFSGVNLERLVKSFEPIVAYDLYMKSFADAAE